MYIQQETERRYRPAVDVLYTGVNGWRWFLKYHHTRAVSSATRTTPAITAPTTIVATRASGRL